MPTIRLDAPAPFANRPQRTSRPSFAWLAMALLLLAGRAPVTAQEGTAGRTVWDGVYTEAQAQRATAIFNQSCASCHSLTPAGPSPLSGSEFWDSYSQTPVADLLSYVTASMPNGRGGTLPAASYNDLVALILKSNGAPPGQTELAPETIAGVHIVSKGGSSELPANALVRVVGCLARQGSDWVLTNATMPERVTRSGPAAEDGTRPLGNRTMALKFVLTRLDTFAGQRMSASGMLMGTGGVDGLNVTTVDRVGETCP